MNAKPSNVYVLTREHAETELVGVYLEQATAKRVAMRELRTLEPSLTREAVWFASHENTRLNIEYWDEGGCFTGGWCIIETLLIEDWEV